MVNPAPVMDDASSESCLVFVVDVSGSMCVTAEISGKVALKGGQMREKEFEDLLRANQGFGAQPGQNRNVTYVSRLQCVQASIENQIQNVARSDPNKRVGLITFSNEVTILGDCGSPPINVAGDRLDSREYLLELGEKTILRRPVGEAKDDLIKALWSLSEEGATALGPAMMLGIGMSGTSPSSQVVLCTDGLSNVGVGSLEGSEEKFQAFFC